MSKKFSGFFKDDERVYNTSLDVASIVLALCFVGLLYVLYAVPWTK